MSHYFYLQYTRLKRLLDDLKLNIYVAILLAVLTFLSLSFLLFYKVLFPKIIYSIICVGFLLLLSKKERNGSLKNWFTSRLFIKIRLLENVLVAMGFMIFLIYKGAVIYSVILFILAIIMSRFNQFRPLSHVLPTPFSKRPFEFANGFRKTIPLVLANVGLLIVSISYNNFNLGLFSLIIQGLLGMSFYSQLEPYSFVWQYSGTTKQFIMSKIKISSLYNIVFSLPFALVLILSFVSYLYIVLSIYFLGQCYIYLAIVSKYAMYPKKNSVMQSIFIAVSMVVFPLLLITIPYFYKMSIKNLKAII